MRKLTAALLASFTLSATAGIPDDIMEDCLGAQQLAKYTMLNRQNGEDFAMMMRMAESNFIAQTITISAYEYPIKETPKEKKDLAEEFAYDVFRTCLRMREPQP